MISKVQKKIKKRFNTRITVTEDEYSIILSGELRSWDDIIEACNLAVQKKSNKHVVNNIKLSGVDFPKMRLPKIKDTSLDGQSFDVVVVGGGISGTSIFRELTKWNINVLLVEKEGDFAMHASGRNDGECHPGIDLKKGTLKLHYLLKANPEYEKICNDLDVPFKMTGQVVGFDSWLYYPLAKIFISSLQKKGITKTSIIHKKEMKEREPSVDDKMSFAVYSENAGNVCPFSLTIAYAENGIQNGGKVSLHTAVTGIVKENNSITKLITNRGTISTNVVINATGCFADDFASMAGDKYFSIHPRRGTNSILDKKASKDIHSIMTLFSMGGRKHTKGGGILKTVHQNLLIGPNAVETYEKENFATRKEDIEVVFHKQKKAYPNLSQKDIITYFTGVRAPTFEEDFIIEFGKRVSNIIHVAGMQSPGFTTAPAVAMDVATMAVDFLAKEKSVQKNEHFNPKRNAIPRLHELDDTERNSFIKKNPDYGIIICRCEEISKGEIVDAIKSSCVIPTLDSIKRRLRPGSGRCQGGFCSPLITKLIAEHLQIPLHEVKKSTESSYIVVSPTREIV